MEIWQKFRINLVIKISNLVENTRDKNNTVYIYIYIFSNLLDKGLLVFKNRLFHNIMHFISFASDNLSPHISILANTLHIYCIHSCFHVYIFCCFLCFPHFLFIFFFSFYFTFFSSQSTFWDRNDCLAPPNFRHWLLLSFLFFISSVHFKMKFFKLIIVIYFVRK